MPREDLKAGREQVYRSLGDRKLKEWRDSQNTKLGNFHDGALVPAFISFVRQNCGAGTAELLNLIWKGRQAQQQNQDTSGIRQNIQNHLESGSENVLELNVEDFDSQSVAFANIFDEMCATMLTSPMRESCLGEFKCEIEEYMRIHVKYQSARERQKEGCSLF